MGAGGVLLCWLCWLDALGGRDRFACNATEQRI